MPQDRVTLANRQTLQRIFCGMDRYIVGVANTVTTTSITQSIIVNTWCANLQITPQLNITLTQDSISRYLYYIFQEIKCQTADTITTINCLQSVNICFCFVAILSMPEYTITVTNCFHGSCIVDRKHH